MESMNGMIGVLILGCGVFCLYDYIKMRSTGKISELLLLAKGQDEKKCKDKALYMKKSMPAVLILAVATTLYGGIDTFHNYVQPLKAIDTVAGWVFLVILVWFAIYTGKLKKNFFPQ